MKPKIGERIPEFMNLNALHMYMAAEYHGKSYSVEQMDENGLKFVWLIDNSTGAKIGAFPVAYLRVPGGAPVRYTAIIKTNVYTELALLNFGIHILINARGYLGAERPVILPDLIAIDFLEDKITELQLEYAYKSAVLAERVAWGTAG